MHARVTSVLLACLVPALASAEVLLERAHTSGHIPEEYSFASTCSLHDTGQITTEHRAGSRLMSHQSQQLQISLTTLRASIAEARNSELVAVEPFPVDGPTLRYRAFRKLADGRQGEVLLWEEDGGAGRKRENTSPAAIRLRTFIDLNCGPVR